MTNHPALYPLTTGQREIWLSQLLHDDLPIYNIGGYAIIPGPIDPALFEQAVNLLVQKHDALRIMLTAEQDEDGIPMQVFAEQMRVTVPVADFCGRENSHEAAMAWIQARFAEPFELIGKPLFRYSLLKLAADNYYGTTTYHHLISDSYSAALLNRSLADIYTRLARNQPPDLGSPSYVSFIENERTYLASETFEKNRKYWLARYPGLPEPLLSPAKHSRVSEDVIGAGYERFYLPRGFYRRLGALAEKHKVTLFHVLLGGLYVYFTRVMQRDDFVIGLPVLNRANAQFRQTAGLFISVNAARFDFGLELDFAELVQRINKTLKENYRHQRFPISNLNRAVGLGQSRPQLFEISLSYESYRYDLVFNEIHVQSHPLLHGYEQTPLVVSVREFDTRQDVEVDFVYNQAYFDADDIKALQTRYVSLLETVQEQDRIPLWQLPIATAREIQQQQTWNQTGTDYPRDKTIVDLFESQVAQVSEDHPAVLFEDCAWSYRELNRRANRLAHYLQSLGVKQDTLVGVCVERSLEMIVGVLGVLKAGGAYVPMDPAYPRELLAFMMSDANVPVLLTQEKLLENLPNQQAQVVLLDKDQEIFAKMPDDNPQNTIHPRNLAYMIYTSGSTGWPKGVLIEHRSLYNLAQAQVEAFGIGQTSRIFQFASLSFDVSISDISMALYAGGALILAPQDAVVSPERITQLLEQHAITHAEIPASVLRTLPNVKLPELQAAIAGGEVCPPDIVTTWSQGRRFFNAYGPTEATVCATLFENTMVEATSILPIGRPISNVQAYILDSHLQPLPVGMPGELHIGGIGVARGYLDRPELTAEKFIEDPFSNDPAARLYKTGDMARYLPDGNIEYLGRRDNQVKIHGFRIELGAIEAALREHHNVRDAAVIVHHGADGSPRLVAHVVSTLSLERVPCQSECLVEIDQEISTLQTKDFSSSGISLTGVSEAFATGKHIRIKLPDSAWLNGVVAWQRGVRAGIRFQLDAAEQSEFQNVFYHLLKEQGFFTMLQRILSGELLAHLQDKLPEYMVPSAFILLNALPLTANGKIDRRALHKLTDAGEFAEDAFVPPQTSEQKRLAEIWRDIMKLERVGIHDDFFELGGHSLLAPRILARIRERCGVELPLRALFEAPTVAELAQVLTRACQRGKADAALRCTLDLEVEAVLDDSIRAPRVPEGMLRIQSPRAVLLTGATGFLGTYLLHDLLRETSADVYCLIRASSVEEGLERLQKTMTAHNLWQDAFRFRIMPIPGDLAAPWLGMPEVQFEQLTRQIDVIYHNGARVNHAYPYQALKAANVQGTLEVLKMAVRFKPKPVHFISSVGVLFSADGTGQEPMRETDVLAADRVMDNGYIQTKWVAEKLMAHARERGLPVTVYRPARIAGHSRSGISNPDDLIALVMKGCIQLGKIPRLDKLEDNITPVDYVSRAIVRLSCQQDFQGKVFHITNPHSTRWADLLEHLRARGYALEEVSFAHWRESLEQQADNPLYPLLPALYQQRLGENQEPVWPRFACENTLEALSNTDITCPRIDRELLERYFSHFETAGFSTTQEPT